MRNQSEGFGAVRRFGVAAALVALGGGVSLPAWAAPLVGTVWSDQSFQSKTVKVGDIVPITITFDEDIVVSGSTFPQLTLQLDSGPFKVECKRDTVERTDLQCPYTVRASDYTTGANNPLDYSGSAALELNGSTIRSSGGVNAELTLPTAASGNSLAWWNIKVMNSANVTGTVSVRPVGNQPPSATATEIYFEITGTNGDPLVSSPTLESGGITLATTGSATGTMTPPSTLSGIIIVHVENIRGIGSLGLNIPPGAIANQGGFHNTLDLSALSIHDVNIPVVAAVAVTPVDPTTIPVARVGSPFTLQLSASGGSGTYVFSSNDLPPGLTLNSTTGVISGTPTQAVTVQVIVYATDSDSAVSSPQSLTIKVLPVLPPALIFPLNAPALPAATAETPYNASILVEGGVQPYGFSLTSGALPPGLTLNTDSGLISGTPTAPGAFAFGITVVDSAVQTQSARLAKATKALAGNSITQQFSITVAAANVTPPVVTPTGGAVAVPTLSEWGMLLMSALLAGLAMLGMRRNKAQD